MGFHWFPASPPFVTRGWAFFFALAWASAGLDVAPRRGEDLRLVVNGVHLLGAKKATSDFRDREWWQTRRFERRQCRSKGPLVCMRPPLRLGVGRCETRNHRARDSRCSGVNDGGCPRHETEVAAQRRGAASAGVE